MTALQPATLTHETAPRRAFTMSTIAFTICFAVRTIFSVNGTRIKKESGLSETQFGLLVGSNLAWCHPVLYQRLVDAREKRPSMKVVLIDPAARPLPVSQTCIWRSHRMAMWPCSWVCCAILRRLQ